MRIDPPPSAARAIGTMAAETAAALPPDGPPGVWSRLQGLREIPKAALSVNGHRASSGTLVLPTSSAPASPRRRTSSASAGAGSSVVAAEPLRVGAGQVDVVLDGHRYPGQRQPVQVGAALEGPGLGPDLLGPGALEGPQPAVEGGDPLQVLQHLDRRRLPRPDGRRKAHRRLPHIAPGHGDLAG